MPDIDLDEYALETEWDCLKPKFWKLDPQMMGLMRDPFGNASAIKQLSLSQEKKLRYWQVALYSSPATKPSHLIKIATKILNLNKRDTFVCALVTSRLDVMEILDKKDPISYNDIAHDQFS